MKEIGKRIYEERGKAGYTQEELANEIGTTRQSISKWEKGEGLGPTVFDIARLCNVFNCDFGYLVGEYECKTRVSTDICFETGLSEKAIDALLNLSEAEKAFLNTLLSSRQNLYFIASAFDDFRIKAVIDNAVNNGDLPDDHFYTARGDLDFSRFTLSNRFMLFAEESVKQDKGA